MTTPAYWRAPKQKTTALEVGSRIGSLTVIATAPSVGTGARYRVRCDAGHERVVRGGELRAGKHGCSRCTSTPDAPEAA